MYLIQYLLLFGYRLVQSSCHQSTSGRSYIKMQLIFTNMKQPHLILPFNWTCRKSPTLKKHLAWRILVWRPAVALLLWHFPVTTRGLGWAILRRLRRRKMLIRTRWLGIKPFQFCLKSVLICQRQHEDGKLRLFTLLVGQYLQVLTTWKYFLSAIFSTFVSSS